MLRSQHYGRGWGQVLGTGSAVRKDGRSCSRRGGAGLAGARATPPWGSDLLLCPVGSLPGPGPSSAEQGPCSGTALLLPSHGGEDDGLVWQEALRAWGRGGQRTGHSGLGVAGGAAQTGAWIPGKRGPGGGTRAWHDGGRLQAQLSPLRRGHLATAAVNCGCW